MTGLRRAGPGEDDPEQNRVGSRFRPLSILALNELADTILREGVGPVWIEGELSRFVAHRSGHWYFTLKDSTAAISCAMFRGRNRSVGFEPGDGQEVLALALPGVYPPQGRYQLVVEQLEPRGHGAAALALEQLKRRLADEGLFDVERKRSLPQLPRRIGVATSIDGAALRDVLRVLKRRFAGVFVLVAPAVVQGRDAAASIVAALRSLDERALDVVMLVRGGGAREDLAAFDDERVVRQVAAMRTPIVTGIGHEIDISLADLAADRRAATPSAAAEIVVREREELRRRLASLASALAQLTRGKWQRMQSRLLAARGSRGLGAVPLRVQRTQMHAAELVRRLERTLVLALKTRRERLRRGARGLSVEHLRGRVGARAHRLEVLATRLADRGRAALGSRRAAVTALAARLDALSPLAVIERGYALVTRDDSAGPLIDDASRLSPGDLVYVRMARGGIQATVRRIDATPEGATPDGANRSGGTGRTGV